MYKKLNDGDHITKHEGPHNIINSLLYEKQYTINKLVHLMFTTGLLTKIA